MIKLKLLIQAIVFVSYKFFIGCKKKKKKKDKLINKTKIYLFRVTKFSNRKIIHGDGWNSIFCYVEY